MFVEKVLDYKGCSIFYQMEVRNHANKWVIFLHGAGVDHKMFMSQLNAIPSDFNILMWDARLHGKSTGEIDSFTMKQLSDDILQIMEIETIDKSVFIGQSMGGNLAQDIAYYYPEKVLGLVLIDCTNNVGKLSLVEKCTLSITKPIFMLYPWSTLVKQSADACSLNSNVKEYVKECFERVGKERLIHILMEVTKCLHEDTYYKIPVPFLLLCGDHDLSGNIKKIAKSWSESEPNCTFHWITNAGHNSNQDNPEEVNTLISRYLEHINL